MKRVILVRTAGPRNAGAVLRAVANFGPAELVFAAPARPSLLLHPEFEQMAHGVEDMAARVSTVPTLGEALADCHHSVGFTARVRDHRTRVDWRAIAPEVGELCDAPDRRVALVFGGEESGLTADEAGLCQRLAFLATSEEHTSINLALSAGIVLSSLFSGRGPRRVEPGARATTGLMREYLKLHMKDVFCERVARTRSAKEDIAGSIDRLFSYADLENRDVRAWQLMLRALGSTKEPRDFGLPGRPTKERPAPEDRAGGE